MTAVSLLGLALALTQPRDPHIIETHKREMTAPISGPDFLLIAKAARHPEIRGRDLSCYRVSVSKEKGIRTVSFLGIPEKLPPDKEGQVALGFPKRNPRCPDRSFEIDAQGRVARVIYSRH